MRTDYRETWPIAYRTQRDADIDQIPFEGDDDRYDWADIFAIGFGIGLLLGLGLIDYIGGCV